MSVGAVE